MLPDFSHPAADVREQALRERFDAAARSPAGLFSYPTGPAGLSALGYPADLLASLPAEVLACYCGVGDPFEPDTVRRGETILDVGCGAGVDAVVAARLAGSQGLVAGLEFSLAMLGRAAQNVRLASVGNVLLTAGRADRLPYAGAVFDRVISNGVFNLVADKSAALAEACRVLKPGGVMVVADQVLDAAAGESCPLPSVHASREERARAWAM